MRACANEPGRDSRRVRSALHALLAAAGLALVAHPGCSPSRPAEPAPGPAASGSARTSTPRTLGVQTFYWPTMRLGLRLDGKPFTGKAWLLPTLSDGFDLPPDSDVPPIDETVELDVQEGEAVVDDAALQKLGRSEAFHLFVQGHRYPYARAGLTNPFRCAQAIAALRVEDPCTEPLPSGQTPPPQCDEGGQGGWHAALDQQTEKIAGCWAALDEPTIAAVTRIGDAPLRAVACAKVMSLAGPSPGLALGLRLFDACQTSFEPEFRAQVTLARRKADLPAALERARRGSSAEMQAFYTAYRVTGDARVDEIRALAAKRFGPKNLAQFLATDRALRALKGPESPVWLCDVGDGRAHVAVSNGASAPRNIDFLGLSAPGGEDRRSCKVAYSSSIRRPRRPVLPSLFERTVTGLVKARLGVKTVTIGTYCGANHWYLREPPLAPPPPGF